LGARDISKEASSLLCLELGRLATKQPAGSYARVERASRSDRCLDLTPPPGRKNTRSMKSLLG